MKRIYASILTVLIASLSCLSTPSESAIQTASAQTESARPISTSTIIQSKTPPARPTNTPLPTKTKSPTKSPTPSIGSRLDPVKVGEQISLIRDSTMYFTIWVEQVIRGNDAWVKIYSTNRFNDKPPEGQEYVLVYLRLKYTQGPQDRVLEFNIRDFVTVSRGQVIDIPWLVMPEPEFDDIALFPGGEAEGWIAGKVYVGDENPLLALGLDPGMTSGFFFSLTP